MASRYPNQIWTKHFLNTHQEVFTTWAVLLDSGQNEDETLTVIVSTHCMNNLCKAYSMNKWCFAGCLMRCSIAEDLLNKLCHDIVFTHNHFQWKYHLLYPCEHPHIQCNRIWSQVHSPPSVAKIKNEWTCTSMPPIHLHDIGRENYVLPFLEQGHSTGSHYRPWNIFLNVLKHYMS